jgi:hypothetical protein
MSASILICPCGRRLKAKGLAPGKSGRCPSCGKLIRVPDAAPAPPASDGEDDEWNWHGSYDVKPVEPPPRAKSRPAEPEWNDPLSDRWPDDLDVDEPEPPSQASPEVDLSDEDEWNWQGDGYNVGAAARPVEAAPPAEEPPLAPGEVLPSRAPKGIVRRVAPPPPEPWWPPRMLYPLRAVEGFGIVAALGVTFWVMGTLVPEYCIALLADGNFLGTPSMGRLVALISALPVVILIPLAIGYWLLYLSRVLVASGAGESAPPRPPDRNFDGVVAGLTPWLLWFVLGVMVGLLPLAAYGGAVWAGAVWNVRVAVGLGLLGFPYALMAFLMTFLHDDSLAANPWAVIADMVKHAPSFLVLCVTTVFTLGLSVAAFAGTFLLRARQFPLFVVAALACWFLLAWCSIVTMHMLGTYYAHRRDDLKWQHERPRWETV